MADTEKLSKIFTLAPQICPFYYWCRDFSLLLFGQECMSDKVSRRDTTNYQKLMNCIKIQLSVDAKKKKYIKHLRSKSLNLSLNMMIHQIKASNYLMAPWITTGFFAGFNLRDGTVLFFSGALYEISERNER